MADTQVDREIRIAVVMYGGSSLAIYMNGIAQELLQLVRATSPNARGQQALTGTARAYRKLAHVLAGTPLDALTEEVLAEPPRVRFLIDILSGTSAGGINAVMLAKALARNADLAPVERLWIDEGAVHALLNDRAGATRRAPYREPVKALFNSDKMYLQLLRALGGLNPADGPAAGAGGRAESAAGAPRPHTDRGPLVDDLDLVVTGTDLQGRIVDLRLADGMAREREHRHVFEFRLRHQPGGADPRADTDEFTAAFDPLLAFAARTTSSLPAVFEPTRVAEVKPLVGRDRRAAADWPLLFRRVPPREREAVAAHAFADGGYLDNKPFGHAVDRLARVSGGRLVTRKLLYLEPVPQVLDPGAPPAPTPDALGNTLDVFSLARYETIRADLERIEARNEVIGRLRTLQAGALEDLAARVPRPRKGARRRGLWRLSGARGWPMTRVHKGDRRAARAAREAEAPDLSTLTRRYGGAYGAYHRLRVATVTDALAAVVADAAGIPASSDLRDALRLVVRCWREQRYARDREPGRAPEAAFLERFDVAFQRRRAVFLLGKINQLLSLDAQGVGDLQHLAPWSDALASVVAAYRGGDERRARRAWAAARLVLRPAKAVAQRAAYALEGGPSGDGLEDAAREALAGQAGHAGEAPRLRDELLELLQPATPEAREAAARAFLRRRSDLVAELARALSERSGALIAASEQALVDLERVTRLRVGSRAVRARRCPRVEQLIAQVRDLLVSYRDAFGGFDAVQFPVLAVTGVGEELSPVAVHRIGAGDAPPDEGDPSEKLFGTRFATFGAFLDARWRAHDIVWGRLDGAERLLSVLAGEAHEGARDALVVEAQQAVLLEAFPEEAAAVRALPRALAGAPGAARADDGGPDRLDPDDGVDADATRRRVRAFMDEKRERLELDPRAAARDLSRLVRVTGRLSDAVTSDANLPRTVKWVLRLAAFAGSNLIDAAVPKTFVHLLTSYWAQLLLLFGVLLIVLGGPWVPWWQPLPGGLGWGLGLAAAALVFLLLRALVWGLLARGRSPQRSARAGARTPRGSRPRG